MRILVFIGGLGNQIFGYAFCRYLKERFPGERFYGLYGRKLSEHYGLEIDKWFRTELPPQPWWVLPLTGLFYLYKKICPDSRWLDLSQSEWAHKDAVVLFPFKLDKKYVPERGDWLEWNVRDESLSLENRQVLSIVRSQECCFVHVRRGDYLSSSYSAVFEGCCTLDYYKNAIVEMKRRANGNLRFIFFSDDMPWVRENLAIDEGAIYVDWNTGADSPLDMYLMSQCPYGIIANSTFSYWGARLGREKKLVCYPAKWWNSPKGNPDIFPDGWIAVR